MNSHETHEKCHTNHADKKFSANEQIKTIMNFDKIINSPLDGLWITDAKGKVLQVNRAAEGLYNINKEMVLNRTAKQLIEEGLFDRSIILKVIKTKKSQMVLHKLKNGKQLLRIGYPIFADDGKLNLVAVYERDMTELYLLRSDLEGHNEFSTEYRAELEQLYTKKGLRWEANIRSEIMYKVLDKAIRLSQVDSTIFLQGESGVGKGYFANLIHRISERKNKPFIRVDCGAIPEQLIEAELFGYERGAFTGARKVGKVGYFEIAGGGTLFLDEVAELPLNVQVKLHRFLENNEFIRIGDTAVRKIDTRVIAATNKNLEKMLAERRFRKDLFFRLNVIPVKIPALRERVDDIPALIHHFLKKFNQKFSKNKVLFPKALECLCYYSYPGNIRELSNLVEQLVVLSPDDQIDLDDLPSYVLNEKINISGFLQTNGWNLPKARQKLEKELITRALEIYKTQREAAKHLGVDHSTLAKKIKKFKNL